MVKLLVTILGIIIFGWSVYTVMELKEVLAPESISYQTRLFISWFPMLFLLWVWALIVGFSRKIASLNKKLEEASGSS